MNFKVFFSILILLSQTVAIDGNVIGGTDSPVQSSTSGVASSNKGVLTMVIVYALVFGILIYILYLEDYCRRPNSVCRRSAEFCRRLSKFCKKPAPEHNKCSCKDNKDQVKSDGDQYKV
uniref:Uncharacterized protein n=1 Tax=Caenorhabditis tropicalis TaxID=1561998 RepID=A0A1I7TAW2_9PELO